jgi:hypothetical protein
MVYVRLRGSRCTAIRDPQSEQQLLTRRFGEDACVKDDSKENRHMPTHKWLTNSAAYRDQEVVCLGRP